LYFQANLISLICIFHLDILQLVVTYLCYYLFICVTIYLLGLLFIYLRYYLFICVTIYLCYYLFTCVAIYLFVLLFIYLCYYLFTCVTILVGFSQWYPFCSVQMIEAVQIAISPLFSELDEQLMLENKIAYISQNVFSRVMASEADQSLALNLSNTVLRGVVFNTVGVLKFGDYDIPLPPANVGKQWSNDYTSYTGIIICELTYDASQE